MINEIHTVVAPHPLTTISFVVDVLAAESDVTVAVVVGFELELFNKCRRNVASDVPKSRAAARIAIPSPIARSARRIASESVLGVLRL